MLSDKNYQTLTAQHTNRNFYILLLFALLEFVHKNIANIPLVF
jgi:hypothetical protein